MLYTLEPNKAPGYDPKKFPTKLSDTGLYANVAKNELAAGVQPFSVNAGSWADGATSERFVALPNGRKVQWHDERQKIGYVEWLPFTMVFEGLGPLIEVMGYGITTAAVLLGVLDWSHYRVLLAVSLLFGVATTLMAVFLSDVTARRYLRSRDLAVLCAAAVLENIGYRQLNSWWGCVGTVQAMTGKGGWGPMKRRQF